MTNPVSRRSLLAGSAATLAAGTLARPASALDGVDEYTNPGVNVIQRKTQHNISSFRSQDWRPYFGDTRNGVILVDTKSRVLHYWSEDQSVYKLYPTSVPLTEELTRLGRTKVVRKVVGPSWAPTPSMLARDPDLPARVPPGPDNPLGTHALYLSWTYYRIHGTHDTRKIGRKSSSGCIGLFNEHIAELFDLAKVGTQVLLI